MTVFEIVLLGMFLTPTLVMFFAVILDIFFGEPR